MSDAPIVRAPAQAKLAIEAGLSEVVQQASASDVMLRCLPLSTGSAAPGDQVQPDRFRRSADSFHCLLQLVFSAAQAAGPVAPLLLLLGRNQLSNSARLVATPKSVGGTDEPLRPLADTALNRGGTPQSSGLGLGMYIACQIATAQRLTAAASR
jgi:hypothetical protein